MSGLTERSPAARRFACAGAVLLAATLAATTTRADSEPYTFEIPDGQTVSYHLGFVVEHPGEVRIEAEWTGSRVLAFSVTGPDGKLQRARRSGRSPQSLTVQVVDEELLRATFWMLTIRALPGFDGGRGTVILTTPDPVAPPEAEPVANPVSEPASPAVAPHAAPALEQWAMARELPAGTSPQLRRFFDRVEAFRSLVVSEDAGWRADTCRWQSDALRYVAGWRDRFTREGSVPEISTRRYLSRLIQAVQEVDRVRESDDPILHGPVPKERARKRAWTSLRQRRIQGLETELDRLLDMHRSGHAPGLETETWVPRMLSCLAGVERHFNERVLVGEARATNLELARAQWEPITRAASALEALTYLIPGREAGGVSPAATDENPIGLNATRDP